MPPGVAGRSVRGMTPAETPAASSEFPPPDLTDSGDDSDSSDSDAGDSDSSGSDTEDSDLSETEVEDSAMNSLLRS